MKNRLCFIVSDVNESHQLNALFRGLKLFGYDVSLIFTGANYPKIGKLFADENYTVEFIECRSKKDFPQTLRKIYMLLGAIKPDIVHTHLQTASLLGLTAARLRGIKRRIHTRHHGLENHAHHPHAVFYDKYCNRLSTQIISISRSVERILIEKESADPARVSVVHHGFQFKDFQTEDTVIEQLREKYDLFNSSPVVGVISRFEEGKGLQFIIPAFAEIVKKHPSAKLVLANAKGSYADAICSLLREYLKPENYVLINFESRVFELYKTFDVFVHTPIDAQYEAFGQTYVESLALEIPSVFTLSGVANDFVVNNKNAIVVPHKNSQAIYGAIKLILEDKELTEKLVRQAKADVLSRFDIRSQLQKLIVLYNNSL